MELHPTQVRVHRKTQARPVHLCEAPTHVDAGEAVEEGAGQALAAAAFLHWVLRRKQAEGGVAAEHRAQLRDEDLGRKKRREVKAVSLGRGDHGY